MSKLTSSLKSSPEDTTSSRKGSVGSGPSSLTLYAGHTGLISDIKLSNSGSVVLTASTDGTIKSK